MTATLWLDTAAEKTLELGGTLQLYQSFADMAHAAGPSCYDDWPDLFGVPSACEDQEDVDPAWLADVRAQAAGFLARFGQQMQGLTAGLLQLLAGSTPDAFADRPVPELSQERPWSCGPASLRAAAAAFGLDVPESRLRELLGADPDAGTPPENLVAGAKALGLAAEGRERMSLPQLERQLILGRPVIVCMIAPWLPSAEVTTDSGHWVVATGRGRQGITLMDPIEGETTLPREEFLARWRDQDADGRLYTRFGIVIQGKTS